jgi:PIN domain nuclease of toxin-antitoxin system
VRCLLDSHTLFWAVADRPRLAQKARSALLDPANEIFVSTLSYYQLGFKAGRGRLSALAAGIAIDVENSDLIEIDIGKRHLIAAASFDWKHGDPWDRILAAQALLEDCAIVSADKVFDEIGVERIW